MKHVANRLMYALAASAWLAGTAAADSIPVQVLDPNLKVTTVINAGLAQPIGIVFLGANDFLVLEKASGQVKRVIGGVIQPAPVLDLAVNSASERGLLSLVLHPNFPATPWAYVRWTESSTGVDTNVTLEVPLLGNRIDRYVWDGSTLTFDRNIIQMRALQTDHIPVPGHPGTNNANPAGNHNGGVMRFGPDGMLYVGTGDAAKPELSQSLDSLGGKILRLTPDGEVPGDNPFAGRPIWARMPVPCCTTWPRSQTMR